MAHGAPVHVTLYSINVMMNLKSKRAAIATIVVSLFMISASMPDRPVASGGKSSIRTVHFTIRYIPGMEELGILTAGLSEDAYARISGYLNHDLTGTITINVWPAHAGPDFADEMRPGTICRFSRAAYGSRYIDVTFPGSLQGLRCSLMHKITHSFIYDMFSDERVPIPCIRALSMPDAFSESIALLLAVLPEDDTERHARARRAPSGPGLYGMTGYPAFPESPAVTDSNALVGLLDAAYGPGSVGEVIRDIRDTGDFEKAIRITTGKRPQDLVAGLSSYAIQHYRDEKQPDLGHADRKAGMNTIGMGRGYSMFPAVSPDGHSIAYLSVDPRTEKLHMASIHEQNGGYAAYSDRTIDIGRGMIYPAENRISWTGDGRMLVMAGRIGNSEAILFVDHETGRIESSEVLPFNAVMFPSISGDRRYIVFTGTAAVSSDIYIYDRKTASIRRITDDLFFKRDPVLAPDGESIIYSTNRNESGDTMKGVFDLIRLDIRRGTSTLLVGNGRVNIQPSLSPDGKQLLYVSDVDGSFNVYMLELASRKTVKLTDNDAGILSPAWLPAGNKIVYAVNTRQGTYLEIGDLNMAGTAK